jgi:hypothetical protein
MYLQKIVPVDKGHHKTVKHQNYQLPATNYIA